MTAPEWLLDACGPEGSPDELLTLGVNLEGEGDLHAAATAYDRAYGLAPDDPDIRTARQSLLDRLSVTELGIHFRYVPAGSFLMGSASGEPDEAPVHPVRLDAYWMAETPVSWAGFCELMGWEPPPVALPPGYRPDDWPSATEEERKLIFGSWAANRIRLQYCEDETLRAEDWHAHTPDQLWIQGGQQRTARELFGEVARENPEAPWGYTQKPMVSVGWELAQMLCDRISTGPVRYRLPTEAEWEKAARGGLIGAEYPWGSAPPTPELCDFDRFDDFSIRPMRAYPPNGYGLYAMSGCVWEWTADWYDAEYYAESPRVNPPGPEQGEARVLRGGSWADAAEAVRVAFRMASTRSSSPTLGFRLCRSVP